ncbi:MAG: ABC transporter ATP-binding protein [bacterium]
MIELKNVHKKYGNRTAIKDLSFRIEEGEILGVLGENGAGKSTALKLIASVIQPDEGYIFMKGYNLSKNYIKMKQTIGYLAQNNPLYEEMLVYEFLKFVANLHKIQKEYIPWKIKTVIKSCNLKTVLSQKISTLSKGYKQRLGLAQALIHEPEILLLDEPTAGLDQLHMQGIQKLIKTIGKKKTIVICTHRIAEIVSLCSKVVVLSRGQLFASGTPDELKRLKTPQESRIVLEAKIGMSALKNIMNKQKEIIRVDELKKDDEYSKIKLSTYSDIRAWIWQYFSKREIEIRELLLEETQLEDILLSLNKDPYANH